MSAQRRYKNPPIEEAVCEFGFTPNQDWDLTIPGRLQAELGAEYTGKPQEQRVIGVGLEARGGQPPNIQFGEGLARIQLVTRDGKRTVGVGQDVLSVHMLRPYQDPSFPQQSGWKDFFLRISAAICAYWKVVEPVGVVRVGIRYINNITIPGTFATADPYLNSALPIVSGLPDQLINFMSRVEYTYTDGIHLVLSQGSIEAPLDHVGILLDLDLIWSGTNPILRAEALSKAEELHSREREAFEFVITDKARELFNGV